jgi:predicted component of type VI protein secretion system
MDSAFSSHLPRFGTVARVSAPTPERLLEKVQVALKTRIEAGNCLKEDLFVFASPLTEEKGKPICYIAFDSQQNNSEDGSRYRGLMGNFQDQFGNQPEKLALKIQEAQLRVIKKAQAKGHFLDLT